MNHAIAILFALLAVGAGMLILVLTRASTPGMIGGCSLVVLGMFCAIPAQMSTAREQLSNAWKSYKNPTA